MARLLLDDLQYRLLDILVREGGQTFAALFMRANARSGAGVEEVLRAAQALYDLSLVDVKARESSTPLSAQAASGAREVWATEGRAKYVDDLTPEQLRRAYPGLDASNVGPLLARGAPQEDPYYFAASHLGHSEQERPGYAERLANGGPRKRA